MRATRTFITYISAGLFTLISSCAFASHEVTAAQLRDDCTQLIESLNSKNEADPTSLASGVCMGYIDGFDDMHVNMAYLLSGGATDVKEIAKYRAYCIPDDTTNRELVNTIVNYINDHPDKAELPAGSVLLILLQEKYPCEWDKTPKTIKINNSDKQAYNKLLHQAF